MEENNTSIERSNGPWDCVKEDVVSAGYTSWCCNGYHGKSKDHEKVSEIHGRANAVGECVYIEIYGSFIIDDANVNEIG